MAHRSTLVLAVLTLTACSGRSTEPASPAARLPPSSIAIHLEKAGCSVEPRRAIIDYGREQGAPLSVSWNVRKGPMQVALIVPDPQEARPNLFDVLPTIGRFESSDDSERPIHEPIWEGGQYVYRYVVTIDRHQCPGEICVRREGQGCAPES